MTVQKLMPKDPKKENEKYLIFLDYTLDKLKNGRLAGISLKNLASNYKTEMGTTLDNSEQKEFMQLYNGLYFYKANNSIDRNKIKDETTKILLKYGSIREYLKQQENQSSSLNRHDNNKTIPNTTNTINIPTKTPSRKMTKAEIWAMVGVIVAIVGNQGYIIYCL